jgi:CheY-like chemotaxis protein
MREAGEQASRCAARRDDSGASDTARPPEETAVPRSPASGEASDTAGATARARILVVDDEPPIRRFVADALRSSGFDVVTARDGRDALTQLYGDTRSPALVLTDIDMPGMGGVELAARIHADRPATRVILMTGRETSAVRARERVELVDGVLLKPFGLAELLHVVLSALARPVRDE